ncbi:DM13 domain-containing protein [Zobellia barbeyronii]|uniref:DM13 domain-containing protein n=1 Tax=Zobellia barbeyronii TaxID=2748009 RepID=A0ABS5WFP1_9FLAO|nr:DM13 domain-containing protein [Zobellia barbeyronii]MBT2162195.1 DM13 domain-containing protein [Zobellia barbeyronii]
MKNRNFSIALVALAMTTFVVSCSDDDVETVTVTETVVETETIEVDSSLPVGDLAVASSGSLTAESGTPTQGLVEIGMDTDDTSFVHFADDFTTELGTGTVGIFLSTSETFTADPANGNPDLMLIGNVRSNGEMFIKLDAAPDAKYTHIILWCATANIPFGNVALN